MPVQKTQAIVIRAFSLREAHKIITFYTPNFGKVKAMAYGVKSPKSKLSGSLELLNHGMLLFNYRENRDLQNLTGFELIEGFDGIRTDFARITYGCYLAELIDAIASEGNANPEVFDLLRDTYQFLTDADDLALLARFFEIKFLDLTGYAPQLSQCANCGSVVTATSVNNTQSVLVVLFSVRHGGLLCGDCQHRDTSAFSIAPGSCELLKTLRKSELGKLSRIRASTRNHRELKLVLSSFIQYHTERNLKSLKFIESVLEV
ncbi:DNA repair protein RecO [Candidatus Poribacteria bacterium]|nr:DNA repair protein RecO [Candidatus Poribacteria bacterium]